MDSFNVETDELFCWMTRAGGGRGASGAARRPGEGEEERQRRGRERGTAPAAAAAAAAAGSGKREGRSEAPALLEVRRNGGRKCYISGTGDGKT